MQQILEKIGQFVKRKKLRILENKAALIIMKTVKHTKFYNWKIFYYPYFLNRFRQKQLMKEKYNKGYFREIVEKKSCWMQNNFFFGKLVDVYSF